jgi:hypothetical protein
MELGGCLLHTHPPPQLPPKCDSAQRSHLFLILTVGMGKAVASDGLVIYQTQTQTQTKTQMWRRGVYGIPLGKAGTSRVQVWADST